MAAGNTTGDRLRRGWRDARTRRPGFRRVALGDSRRPVPPRGGRSGRALRAVATRREPRDGRLPRGDRARVANLELRADAAAAQRTGRPATAAPAPAAFRVREPLLRDHALRDADRDADMAVRPAPRRVPRGAQRDGGKHGDLPADLVHPGRAAAAAVRVGIADLAAQYGESVYGAVGSTAGADQLSAMPSVHVAWSVLVAWAVITRARGRWRWLILLHPAATVFVVVATGNHFWADAIVAVVIDAAVISTQSLVVRYLRRPARVVPQAAEPASPEPASPAASSSSRTLARWAGASTPPSGTASRRPRLTRSER